MHSRFSDDFVRILTIVFKQMEEFHVLSKEILNLPAKAYFTMVHLDCEELKQGLAKKAKNYAEKLLERVITTHREQTLKLVTFVVSL